MSFKRCNTQSVCEKVLRFALAVSTGREKLLVDGLPVINFQCRTTARSDESEDAEFQFASEDGKSSRSLALHVDPWKIEYKFDDQSVSVFVNMRERAGQPKQMPLVFTGNATPDVCKSVTGWT